MLLSLRHLLRVLTNPYKTTLLTQHINCHYSLKTLNRIVRHRVITHELQNHKGMMLFIFSDCQQKLSTKRGCQVFSVSHTVRRRFVLNSVARSPTRRTSNLRWAPARQRSTQNLRSSKSWSKFLPRCSSDSECCKACARDGRVGLAGAISA